MFSRSLQWMKDQKLGRFWRLSHYCQAEETHYGPNEPVCRWSRARNLTWWNLEPIIDHVECRRGGGGQCRDLDQLGGGGETDWIWLQGRRNCFLDWRLSASRCLSVLKICFLDCVTIWFLEFQLDWNLVKIILTFSFAINCNRDTSLCCLW